MNGKCWGAWSVAVMFLLAILCSARAEEAKDKEATKAEDFKSQTFDLKAKGKKQFEVSFPEDKTFVLTVRSKKDSDVNLFIYDGKKEVVAKDDSPGPSCDLKFKAKKAGTYYVVVVNKGPGENTSSLKITAEKSKE